MKQIVLLLLLHVLAVSRVKARTHDASLCGHVNLMFFVSVLFAYYQCFMVPGLTMC